MKPKKAIKNSSTRLNEMKGKKDMRFNMTTDDTIMLLAGIRTGIDHHKNDMLKIFDSDRIEMLERLYKEINRVNATPISTIKRNATLKANEIRVKKARRKIETAINLLRLENREITVYSVSKEAKVSYNTVKKYKYLIETD